MKKVFILIFSIILFTSNFAASNYNMQNDLTSEYQEIDNILSLYNEKQNNQTIEIKSKTKLQVLLTKISNSPTKINAAFDWVTNHLNTILTKKGAIKTLLILGPLFSIYCYFFPPEPVKYLIKKIVKSSVTGGSEILITAVNEFKENKSGVAEAITELTKINGELQGIYNINKEIGETSGFFSGFGHSFWPTTGTLVGKAISYGITVGIPFLIGTYSKDVWIAGIKNNLLGTAVGLIQKDLK